MNRRKKVSETFNYPKNVDGKDVRIDRPYQVIDPILGKLYFTADEFKDLLTIAGSEVLVSK